MERFCLYVYYSARFQRKVATKKIGIENKHKLNLTHNTRLSLMKFVFFAKDAYNIYIKNW